MTLHQTGAGRWIVQFGAPASAEVRLICFPPAGGGASAFYQWSRLLGPSVAVGAVQLPGRENRLRQAPAGSLNEIVVSVMSELEGADPLSTVIFGHSMGAILAFELARQFRRRGRAPVRRLVVSGRPAPHLPSRAPSISHLARSHLLLRAAEVYGGIPAAVLGDPEMAELAASALKADLAMIERYDHVAEEPLDCPITALGGADDPWVTAAELSAWREHTRSAFSFAQHTGDHFYYRRDDSLQAVFSRLRD